MSEKIRIKRLEQIKQEREILKVMQDFTGKILHNNVKCGFSLNFPLISCFCKLVAVCCRYCYGCRWPLCSGESISMMVRNFARWQQDQDLFLNDLKNELLSMGSPMIRLSGTGEVPIQVASFLYENGFLFWDYTRSLSKALKAQELGYGDRINLSVDKSRKIDSIEKWKGRVCYLIDVETNEIPDQSWIDRASVFFLPDCSHGKKEMYLSLLPQQKLCGCDLLEKERGICFKCRRCLP